MPQANNPAGAITSARARLQGRHLRPRMVFKTLAMRIRVPKPDDLIAKPLHRVPAGTRKWFAASRTACRPKPLGGAALQAIGVLAKPGKPSRLAFGFAPGGLSRKSSPARGARFEDPPQGIKSCLGNGRARSTRDCWAAAFPGGRCRLRRRACPHPENRAPRKSRAGSVGRQCEWAADPRPG